MTKPVLKMREKLNDLGASNTARMKLKGEVPPCQLWPEVYLKCAFVASANSALLNAERCGYRHIIWLYQRIKPRRGHGNAKVAVARHPLGGQLLDAQERRALWGSEVVHATLSAPNYR